MCVTICGRFCPDEGVVAGYDNRIWAKYTAKWGVQIAGMIFQTRSKARNKIPFPKYEYYPYQKILSGKHFEGINHLKMLLPNSLFISLILIC